MIEYLKEENRILRSRLPKTITVTPRERELGKRLGSAINELISIATPRSFARWVAGESTEKRKAATHMPGRPRTAEEIRELVLRLARETGWGYARILGELKKLGIRKVSKTTSSAEPEAILGRSAARGRGATSSNAMPRRCGPPTSCRCGV